jgi:hypothetical protein
MQLHLMSGAGNRFAVVDAVTDALPADMPQLARDVCAKIAPKVDGLLVAARPTRGGNCAPPRRRRRLAAKPWPRARRSPRRRTPQPIAGRLPMRALRRRGARRQRCARRRTPPTRRHRSLTPGPRLRRHCRRG